MRKTSFVDMSTRRKAAPHDAGVSIAQTNPTVEEPLLDLLIHRGVPRSKANAFLKNSRCRNKLDLAVYLRFQLPPFEFGNAASIEEEVEQLFGIRDSKATRRLLCGLGITGVLPDVR